jgi:hypothetical protein
MVQVALFFSKLLGKVPDFLYLTVWLFGYPPFHLRVSRNGTHFVFGVACGGGRLCFGSRPSRQQTRQDIRSRCLYF